VTFHAFDLVRLDAHMLRMNGLEVAGTLLAWQEWTTRHLPTLGRMAHAVLGDRETYLAAYAAIARVAPEAGSLDDG
jgi:CheY-like chemotaxis protein